jgi:hypothetical protein
MSAEIERVEMADAMLLTKRNAGIGKIKGLFWNSWAK